MFSNWQGLNILSYDNWIVSPLMEMCQTCPCTQQTADTEWQRVRVLKVKCGKTKNKWKEKKWNEILTFYLPLKKKKDAMIKQNSCALLPCSFKDSFYLFALIFILWYIYSLLASGLPECCWFWLHHNPPGYLVRFDSMLKENSSILCTQN